MKSKKYHSVGKIPKSNIKVVERGKTDTPYMHKYMTPQPKGPILVK
jgi:hypothetical protein